MRRWHRILLGIAVVVMMVAHSQDVIKIGLLERLDWILYDAKLRLTMPRTVDERVVILDIDERSLVEQGRWPWNRDKMAAIIDKLFAYYAVRVVGFDVVFAEKDTSSGIQTLESLARKELRGSKEFQTSLRDLRSELDFDGRFAKSIKGRAVVLGYFTMGEEGSKNIGAHPPPLFDRAKLPRETLTYTYRAIGGNLEVLQNAAAGAGHFTPLVDFDGLTRRVPMLVEYDGGLYETLSLAMLRNVLGNGTLSLGVADGTPDSYIGYEWLDVRSESGSSLRIPIDEALSALIPYRGFERSFPYYSLTDVIKGEIPKEKLAGKIVLVGTSAAGLKDLRATPVGEVYPGVEVHANMIAGALDGTIKHRPQYVIGLNLLIVLILGALSAFIMPKLSPMRATVLFLLLVATIVVINLTFWQFAHVVVPAATALAAVALIYVMNMSLGFFVESRTKRQFAQLFGQYVPPELVDEMAKNPESYTMDGRKEELTVLFSDVRGFTTISEGLQPEQLAALMNEYLGAMTKVIRHNRGTLDKYIGDAIMAFWGAPVSDPDHAFHATLTALEMQVGMKALNVELLEKGWPELKIGVGVNTGNMTVGDMGSPVRKAYTVMGDAVNLGSRLEGITKQYGVGILVGEETYVKVKDRFVFRELDRVRVKGKAEPVGIYEPLGVAGAVDASTMDTLAKWNDALAAYRAQDWNRADLLLASLHGADGHYLYELYQQRIEHCREHPPGAGWDGVTTFETK